MPLKQLLRVGLELRRRFDDVQRGPTVLHYHRIGDTHSDPFRLAVTETHFEQHLAVLEQRATVVSLEELMDGKGSSSGRTVAICFDDGYADNLHAATPLLERQGLPATVFVTTGNFGAEFWWDTLVRMLWSPPQLPETLELGLLRAGETFRIENLGVRGSPMLRRPVGQNPAEARLSLLRRLHPILRDLQPEARSEILDRIGRWAGIDTSAGAGARSLTVPELQRLANSPLIAIGGHSVSHPMLSQVDTSRQQREIVDCRHTLQELIDREIRTFAYPFGRRREYTSDSVQTVRSAGYRYAFVAEPGPVTRADNQYEIPRRWIDDWDAEEFERRLERWLPAS